MARTEPVVQVPLSDLARVGAHPRTLGLQTDGQTATGGEGARWLWRHRREVAPAFLILILVGAATRGHMANPGLAWWPLVAGVPAVLVGRMIPAVGRWGAGGLAALAVWTTIAWSAGIDSPPALWGLALLAVGLVAWWRYQSPRSRIVIVGGSPWPWRWEEWCFRRRARREMGRVLKAWKTTAQLARLRDAHLRLARADIDGPYVLEVDLARGMTSGDIDHQRLESALRVPWPIRVEYGERSWEIRIVEQVDTLPDDEADDEVGERPELSVVRPEQDETAIRLDRLLAAMRDAGERLSGRAAARAAGLPHAWVATAGLPELARRGEIVKTDAGWEPVRGVEEAT